MSMKILFLADVSLANPTSGSEQVLHQQATGLAREGIEVCAITRHADSASSIIRNVTNVQERVYHASEKDITRSFFYLMKYPSKFYRRLGQNRPFQAIVCHQPFSCLSLLIRRRLQDVSLLYVFHSPSHEEYLLSQENKCWLRNLVHAQARRMIERFCLKKAMKIMVLSHYMKEKLWDIYGIPANRIVVNPGGVDLNRFRPPRNRGALREKLGFPKGKIHLLSVRNLEPRMGLDNLLQCVRILRKNPARIHLILGGEGIERQNLERLIKEYHLADAVTMTGFIPSDLLPQYYGASDFFILPTRYLEGFGLVTPESMACGTPVLGTPVGATTEILSGLSPDFLFRDTSPDAMVQGIQKAITRFSPSMKRYEQLRDRCREYAVKRYSWQRHINQLKTMIEEVVVSKNYLFHETPCQES